MSDEEEVSVETEVPKGRGRGRGGGVPLLPTGVWQSLQGNDDNKQKHDEVDQFLKDAKSNQFHDAHPVEREDRDFNTSRRNTGPGYSKDLKGKDWVCSSCTNDNWSWRTNCNMCGTPKPYVPVGDGEFRDGAGGGFNERQERASGTTVEVDEEGFDDFGRRVKKEQKAADRKAKEEAALKRLQDKYQYLVPGSGASIPATTSQSSSGRVEEDKRNTGSKYSFGNDRFSTQKGNNNKDSRDQRNQSGRDSRDRRNHQRNDNIKSFNRHESRDSRDRNQNQDRRRDDFNRDKRNRDRSRSRSR